MSAWVATLSRSLNTGNGDGVRSELEADAFISSLGFQHAVAGFLSAAGLGNDD